MGHKYYDHHLLVFSLLLWMKHDGLGSFFDTASGSGPSGSEVACHFSILGRQAPSCSVL